MSEDRDPEGDAERQEQAEEAAGVVERTIRANEVEQADGDDWFAGGLEADLSAQDDPPPAVADVDL